MSSPFPFENLYLSSTGWNLAYLFSLAAKNELDFLEIQEAKQHRHNVYIPNWYLKSMHIYIKETTIYMKTSHRGQPYV